MTRQSSKPLPLHVCASLGYTIKKGARETSVHLCVFTREARTVFTGTCRCVFISRPVSRICLPASLHACIGIRAPHVDLIYIGHGHHVFICVCPIDRWSDTGVREAPARSGPRCTVDRIQIWPLVHLPAMSPLRPRCFRVLFY